MSVQYDLYCGCGEPATWIRQTQFSGNHPFCAPCAQKEGDFGKEISGQFFWGQIPPCQVASRKPKHPIEVDGYEGRRQLLVARIHGMRYDALIDFYKNTASELWKLAKADQDRGYTQLAVLTTHAALLAEQMADRYERMWKLSKPHMKDEL